MYHFLISLADIICTGFYKAPLLKSTSSTCFSFLYVFSAQLGPQDPQQHHLLRSCRLTYRHKHAPQPHQWIQHKHRCIRANFSPSSIHPSFHPIHPSRLTSEEDGATDAALASAAPPLKGHTCSLRRGAIFCWNDRWHQNKILEKTELWSRTVAPDSVFIYCRSPLLLPSLYFAWQHWVARACAVTANGRPRDPQLTALLLTEEEENMALTVGMLQSLWFCVWWANRCAVSSFACVIMYPSNSKDITSVHLWWFL